MPRQLLILSGYVVKGLFASRLKRRRRSYCGLAASAADVSSARQTVRLGTENELAAAGAAEPLAMCGVSVWLLWRSLDVIQTRPILQPQLQNRPFSPKPQFGGSRVAM